MVTRTAKLLALSATLIACATGSDAQTTPSLPPTAPAELGSGPIDESAQLERIRAALRRHYRSDNDDTRFIIDRNDRGLFRMMRNVGLVHFRSEDGTGTSVGTGTLISPCFVLTAYHVVEGKEVIEGDKIPETARWVKFSLGAIYGLTGGFSVNSMNAVTNDPGILRMQNRRFSDDLVLLRLNTALPQFDRVLLDHVFGREMPSSHIGQTNYRIFAAGFPLSEISTGQKRLFGDFCDIRASTAQLGLQTNCVLTRGMSGGPVIDLTQNGFRLVGVNVLPSLGDGRFPKNSTGTSFVAPLTPAKIAKIRAVIDRSTDDHCMPTDGKPW